MMRVQDPDVRIHALATRKRIGTVTRELSDILGAKLVAYIGCVKETRAVREWSEGKRTPQGDTPERLRLAYTIAKSIADSDGRETAQAWFQGLNPLLGDRSPASLLREGKLSTDGQRVLKAERYFLANG
jgi:hypothetical protein